MPSAPPQLPSSAGFAAGFAFADMTTRDCAGVSADLEGLFVVRARSPSQALACPKLLFRGRISLTQNITLFEGERPGLAPGLAPLAENGSCEGVGPPGAFSFSADGDFGPCGFEEVVGELSDDGEVLGSAPRKSRTTRTAVPPLDLRRHPRHLKWAPGRSRPPASRACDSRPS